MVEVNDGFSKISGYSREETVGKSTIGLKIWKDPEMRQMLINTLIKKGSCENFEAEFLRKNGSSFIGLLSAKTFMQHGETHAISITRDITDRKIVEAELKIKNEQLNELIATKDKFFSIIAHDLISPFNIILGFSNTLKKEGRDLDIDSILKYAEVINTSAQNTYRLLENLLDWARMQQGGITFEPGACLFNGLLKPEMENLKYTADQKNITLRNDTKEEIIITADEKMISTVLRNLISNAIKFTPNGGTIHIDAIRMTGQVEISISDTGIGMTPETIENLFRIETSFTTRGTGNEKGSGLGLLLCKEFVEKHGGRI